MAAMKANGHRWTSFVVYGKWNTETALTLLLHTPPHYGPEVGSAAADTAPIFQCVCIVPRGGCASTTPRLRGATAGGIPALRPHICGSEDGAATGLKSRTRVRSEHSPTPGLSCEGVVSISPTKVVMPAESDPTRARHSPLCCAHCPLTFCHSRLL